MWIVMEPDECWSLMTVIGSYVIDRAGLSQDGKQRVRKWRTDRAEGGAAMNDLAARMNGAIGGYLDEKTARVVRKRGRYVSKKDLAR